MLSSKPIIYAVDEPGCVVEREKCGISVEAENVKELYNAIIELANMTPEDRMAMGLRGKQYAETLKWADLAENFINIFKN